MKLFARSALVAATMLAPVSMAAAATTITQTSNFGPTKTETSFTGSLAGFDSSLGTLTNVLITYTFGFNSSGTVTNTAQQAQTFTAKEDVDGALTLSGSYSATGDLDPGVSQKYTNLGAGQSAAFGPFSFATTAQSTTFSFSSLTDDLSSFVNALNYQVDTQTGQGFTGGGGNTSASLNTTAQGTVSIAYTYDVAAAVPEPASWAMMVGGFGMLGGALRRKRGITVVTFG
ncbi:hypothetical protein FHS31_002532 [Sphingomonas vulcanisoli]|uniref:Ice-binding protein C-terminal domain-containing protein n=1 Tax=Sphingomonas vulcanisoli TaxID=1658060 RepID=A0ABX0TTS1_9SPHN|nr:choice-of-anchor E domain-containing protein [Sphingomonas vulcanisoli]NIJ08908.1 hypothetical protein [Sphingomonas vulcanisoli]